MKALSMAIDFYRKYNVELSQLIHHSDRGVQYCCNESSTNSNLLEYK